MLTGQSAQVPSLLLEQLALDDYRRHVGEFSLVRRVCIASSSGETYRWLSRPARVRVCETPRDKIVRWDCKDILSSVWNVELMERHPDIPAGTSLSIDGKAYTMRGCMHRGDFNAAQGRARYTRTSELRWAALQFARAAMASFDN